MKRWLLVSMLLTLSACGRFALIGVVDEDVDAAVPAATADAGRNDAGVTQPSMLIDDCKIGNVADLDAAGARATLSTTHADPTQRLLYPYDETVFPGGLSAPLLMWAGPDADAVLLGARSGGIEYLGCLEPTGDHQLAFPQKVWERFANARPGASAVIDVQLTTLSKGKASGPMRVRITIAGARFAGSVYYMSYADTGNANSAVMRARPGELSKVLLGGLGCTGCHSLSANGTRLLGYTQGFSVAFDIDRTTTDNPTAQPAPLPGGELAGMYPDGTMYVAPAHPAGVGARTYFAAPQVNAGLYDIATGTSFANAGIPIGAMTPAFSPSGGRLVFNDFAIDKGHGLALMDFSAATTTASNYRPLFRDTRTYPAWPNFLPNDSAVVFARGDSADFSGSSAFIGARIDPGPRSDLYLVNVDGGEPLLLARAMGFTTPNAADADSYLPFGALDQHQNYYPSVFPVASGRYFWVFFDSIRNYGNQGVMRQIWGAAIDIAADGGYVQDPSHPAFYLPGQSSAAASLRSVAVIDPCQANGDACAASSDCCSGTCSSGVCSQSATVDCAALDALCTADADCCDRTQACVAGYCRVLP